MKPPKKHTYWHIMPKQIIDYEKYTGRGRPRKKDYKVTKPGEGMISHPVEIIKIVDKYTYKVKVKFSVDKAKK